MVLFTEILLHLASFDLAWFVPLFMNNLLWLFIFGSLAHFILGKNPVIGAIVIALYLFAIDDVVVLLGWVYQNGFFFAAALAFIAVTTYDAFFQNGFSGIRRPVFVSVAFYAALFSINVFM